MCNGYRHPDGCECGFGPPYLGPKDPFPPSTGRKFLGVIRTRKRDKWASKSIINKENLIKGLDQLDVEPGLQRAILEKYSTARYPLKQTLWEELSREQQESASEKMMRAIGLRFKIVKELKPIDLEIPLFRLQPPKTPGSIVSYEETMTRTPGWSVFVKVPGFGAGSDLSFYVQGKGIIQTAGDECKMIILPLSIKRYLVNVYLGKLCIAKKRLITEAGNKKTGQILSRTIKSCKDFIAPSPGATLVADYNLLRDQSHINTKFSIGWGKKVHNHAEFTIPISGISTGIQVSIDLEHEVQLEFDLEPRRDYKLYPIPEGLGISWKVSKKGR